MRFTAFLFLSAVVLLSSCRPKTPEIIIVPDYEKNHLQRNHLMGKVQSISSTLYYDNTSDSTRESRRKISTTIHEYSPDGYLLKVTVLDKADSLVSVQSVFYRKDAKEDYWIETNHEGKVVNRSQYEYDVNNHIASEKLFHLDSMIYAVYYKTDGVGNVIEMKEDHITHTLRSEMEYNLYGLVSRIDQYDPNNKLFKYVTIEYDNFGDEVNRRVFRNKNNIIEYTYTQYDDYGKLLKVIYEDRLHNYREVYDYPEHDAEGNWTMEIRQKANGDTYIRERIIKYY